MDRPGGLVARLERFDVVDSTQRIVREWLAADVPEVAVAVADVQSQGRGRQGRGWTAPPGAALLLSCGFRPSVPPRHVWRVAATVSLAMIDAAEDAAGLLDGTLSLKWPNDIVVGAEEGKLRKVAGVLGEAALEGDRVASVVVGLGINVDWAAVDFPSDLADGMASLREVSGGRPVDRDALLEGFLLRLEARYEALRSGRFDSGGWSTRQATTARVVQVTTPDGVVEGTAAGVEPDTGGLLLDTGGARQVVDSGEVVRCRITGVP